MDNWYEKIAKTGLLGTRAKVTAEAGRGEWSSQKPEDPPKDKSPMARALDRSMAPKKPSA